MSKISIHVPTRGTTKKALGEKKKQIFQSTFPRGERLFFLSQNHKKHDFNPRSHEGNDTATNISLHFPLDFNPRSHEGNDESPHAHYKKVAHFNPRSHEGNDSDSVYSSIGTMISIHVPTRGTTVLVTNYKQKKYDFNPRSHEGNDS